MSSNRRSRTPTRAESAAKLEEQIRVLELELKLKKLMHKRERGDDAHGAGEKDEGGKEEEEEVATSWKTGNARRRSNSASKAIAIATATAVASPVAASASHRVAAVTTGESKEAIISRYHAKKEPASKNTEDGSVRVVDLLYTNENKSSRFFLWSFLLFFFGFLFGPLCFVPWFISFCLFCVAVSLHNEVERVNEYLFFLRQGYVSAKDVESKTYLDYVQDPMVVNRQSRAFQQAVLRNQQTQIYQAYDYRYIGRPCYERSSKPAT